MSTPTDEFMTLVQRTQDLATAAAKTWTDAIQHHAENITTENPLPSPAEVHTAVDAWFGMVNDLVAEQRTFIKALVDASAEVGATVAKQARAAAIAASATDPAASEAPATDAPATDAPAAETPKRGRSSRTVTA